jgi:uncharacterized protein YbjT (DUF2867 family)
LQTTIYIILRCNITLVDIHWRYCGTTQQRLKVLEMKIVVVGASGLIGTKTVERLRKKGHEVVPASRRSGVDVITGEGLSAAMQGADVVVDVSNSPSWEDAAVMDFFEKSTRNMLAAEATAGIKHHVALSIVGTERLQDSGYFRAKLAQEKLIKAGKTPYTIVQATQFFEFLEGIAQFSTVGQTVILPSASFQPIAADDVADEMVTACLSDPINGTIEIAGPERGRMNEIIERYLKAAKDPRQVVPKQDALYYGAQLNDQSLVPGTNGKLTPTTFEQWFRQLALVRR